LASRSCRVWFPYWGLLSVLIAIVALTSPLKRFALTSPFFRLFCILFSQRKWLSSSYDLLPFLVFYSFVVLSLLLFLCLLVASLIRWFFGRLEKFCVSALTLFLKWLLPSFVYP